MSAYRAALLALFIVGGALVTAVPAGATADDGVGASGESVAVTGPVREATTNNSTNNTSLGADISSFMQSSAAEVSGAVETGMWVAEFNATENRSVRIQLVERRTGELRTQLARLQQRKRELVSEREAGNVSQTAYKAKISNLLGRIDALQSAINVTTTRARRVDVKVDELAALGSEADNLTGPEIASVARNVTGVAVAEGGRGPPSDAGNGSDVGNGDGAVGSTDEAGAANDTTNASRVGGPPSDTDESPMVSNRSANATESNANVSASPSAGINDSTGLNSTGPNSTATANNSAGLDPTATANNSAGLDPTATANNSTGLNSTATANNSTDPNSIAGINNSTGPDLTATANGATESDEVPSVFSVPTTTAQFLAPITDALAASLAA